MNASDWDYVDDATVAVGPDGVAAVAWADQGRQDVLLQLYGPDGEPRLEEPADVSRSPEVFSWLPRVAVTDDEPPRIYLLWQEIVFSGGSHGGEAFFARSVDGGRSFEAPLNLSRSPAGDGKGRLTARLWDNGSLDLAVGPGGEVFAAWTEYEGRLWLARSDDGGGTFTDPIHMAGGDEAPARAPSLAAGPGDTVRVAWSVGEEPAADLRLSTSADGGRTFGPPRTVLGGQGHADAPRIAVDGRGTLHLAYGESADGPGGAYRVLYARSGDGGASFEDPRAISDPHTGSFGSASYPEVRPGDGDEVYVVWHLFPGAGRLRARGLGLTASRDGGATFLPPTVVPGTVGDGGGPTGSLQGRLLRRLAVTGPGSVALVHTRFRRGEASRVWLRRAELSER